MVFVFKKAEEAIAETIKPVIQATYVGAALAQIKARGENPEDFILFNVHMDGNTPVVNGQRWIGAPRHRSTPVEKALHALLLK